MVLIRFVVIADLNIPIGDDEFYALTMQEYIGRTSLDEIDYYVEAF